MEGGVAVGCGRASQRLCFRDVGRHAATRCRCVAWGDHFARTQLVSGRFAGRRRRHRRVRRRRECGRVCGGCTRCRCAGQRDRQAGLLRFFLRRHRQSLAAGHRNFNRRRGAGLCPGNPRQARGAAAERLRGLGGCCRALARCAEACRAVFRGAAQVLADFHRLCGCRSRPGAGAGRLRQLRCGSERPGSGGRERIGDFGRRRTGRSGIADIACRARAAIRGRDLVRRSRVARGDGLRAP